MRIDPGVANSVVDFLEDVAVARDEADFCQAGRADLADDPLDIGQQHRTGGSVADIEPAPGEEVARAGRGDCCIEAIGDEADEIVGDCVPLVEIVGEELLEGGTAEPVDRTRYHYRMQAVPARHLAVGVMIIADMRDTVARRDSVLGIQVGEVLRKDCAVVLADLDLARDVEMIKIDDADGGQYLADLHLIEIDVGDDRGDATEAARPCHGAQINLAPGDHRELGGELLVRNRRALLQRETGQLCKLEIDPFERDLAATMLTARLLFCETAPVHEAKIRVLEQFPDPLFERVEKEMRFDERARHQSVEQIKGYRLRAGDRGIDLIGRMGNSGRAQNVSERAPELVTLDAVIELIGRQALRAEALETHELPVLQVALQQSKEIGTDELLDLKEHVVEREHPVEDVVAIDNRAGRQYLRHRVETAARDDRGVRDPHRKYRNAEESRLEGEITRYRDHTIDMW